MEQYIPKADLVAEIESKIEKYTKRGEESDAKCDGYGMYWGGVLSCLNEIRTLCDTLEVKEIDSNDSFIEKACDAYCKACNKPSYSVPIPFCRRRCESYNNFIKNIKL